MNQFSCQLITHRTHNDIYDMHTYLVNFKLVIGEIVTKLQVLTGLAAQKEIDLFVQVMHWFRPALSFPSPPWSCPWCISQLFTTMAYTVKINKF